LYFGFRVNPEQVGAGLEKSNTGSEVNSGRSLLLTCPARRFRRSLRQGRFTQPELQQFITFPSRIYSSRTGTDPEEKIPVASSLRLILIVKSFILLFISCSRRGPMKMSGLCNYDFISW
jgi:hypothetical protein